MKFKKLRRPHVGAPPPAPPEPEKKAEPEKIYAAPRTEPGALPTGQFAFSGPAQQQMYQEAARRFREMQEEQRQLLADQEARSQDRSISAQMQRLLDEYSVARERAQTSSIPALPEIPAIPPPTPMPSPLPTRPIMEMSAEEMLSYLGFSSRQADADELRARLERSRAEVDRRIAESRQHLQRVLDRARQELRRSREAAAAKTPAAPAVEAPAKPDAHIPTPTGAGKLDEPQTAVLVVLGGIVAIAAILSAVLYWNSF